MSQASAVDQDSSRRLYLFLVSSVRIVVFSALILFLDHLIILGTNPWWLVLASAMGTGLATRLAFTKLRLAGFSLLLLGLYLIFRGFVGVGDFLPAAAESNASLFSTYLIALHGNLFFLSGSLAALSTWAYWRYRHTVTIELLTIALSLIYFFSGHRSFHFDTPQLVNTLAWKFGVGNLAMLIFIGLFSVVFLVGYLYLSTMPGRPVARAERSLTHSRKPQYLGVGIICIIFITIVAGIGKGIFGHYEEISLSRTANGVGQDGGEGLSPLGFHSALGSTNQPAALVRLEGDYAENPFLPMLYLREAALSLYSGRELVIAPPAYDRDVSFGSPGTPFTGSEDLDLLQRIPLVQSMYLLTKHDNAFAVDYPISISQLKNPSPERFTAAFKAYSVAPSLPISALESASVGDPRWTEEERQMYLTQHSDSRYAELAKEITKDITNPALQSLALTSYLNSNAIYTLSPNHEVEPDSDPVAPFLFGDMRGYCVHFAHATVYMMRALGIPARIGTGYLTDLSQARDGHILLRMSDRHAWAEAYFEGAGWIPFDTQPTQVESHADSEVDMKLLEELMGIIGPDEEILPESLTDDELGVEEPTRVYIPSRYDVAFVVILVLFLVLIANAMLLLRWLLPVPLNTKVRWLYTALESALHNVGYRRYVGETLLEYRARLLQTTEMDNFRTPHLVLSQKYAPTAESVSKEGIALVSKADLKDFQKLSFFKRLLMFLNPSALVSKIGRGAA